MSCYVYVINIKEPVGHNYVLLWKDLFILVFGFYRRVDIFPERGEDYSVKVGFLSGSLNEIVEFDIILNLGTARKYSY